MDQEHTGLGEALLELRRQLEDGLATARLSKVQLARKAHVSRTTTFNALQPGAPVPSQETVAALAKALNLSVKDLLELRRQAASPSIEETSGPGRPLSEWDPHDLEVHPAGEVASDRAGVRKQPLSGYVKRAHDRVLAQAVREAAAGDSRMVVLVGSSSTGKTRACWEAVQPLSDLGWRLWHPFDPTRADAALEDLHRVGPRTVVWLNEAQHYLGDHVHGERIAAAVHHLLTALECAPVLVLGTLWPEYADRYSALPRAGGPDPHSRTRELLSGRRVTVPDAFDSRALAAARSLADAGDHLLAGALSRASGHGRVAQDLAGAPELLRRYEEGGPAARAILQAAMDARRLGVGLDLAQSFLTDAAVGYLTDIDFQDLAEDWAEAAYAQLGRPVHGKQAPLPRNRPRPTGRTPSAVPGPVFRLADYLEQHGRIERRLLCPPASFWHAAHTHLTAPDTQMALGEAARLRWRLRIADQLFRGPAEAGHPEALVGLARIHDVLGNDQNAETMYERAADAGTTAGMNDWYWKHRRAGDDEAARQIDERAAAAGDIAAWLRTEAQKIPDEQWVADQQQQKAEQAEEAAAAGYASVVDYLTELTQNSWTEEGYEQIREKAGDHGYEDPYGYLSIQWSLSGHKEVEFRLYEAAADDGHPEALYRVAQSKFESGDVQNAVDLASKAAEAGHVEAAQTLAREMEKLGDLPAAVRWYRHAAEYGDADNLLPVIHLQLQTYGTESALSVCREAADTGCVDLLHSFSWNEEPTLRDLCLYGLEPDGTPSEPW